MNRLRGTGRTSRMLARATELEGQGRAVYVIAANDAQRRLLRSSLPRLTSIKVETADSTGNFNWDTMSLQGVHPNCAVLVDHFAIESRFSRIVNELHAYDADPPAGVDGSPERR